jgi:hypothetical protein
MVPERGRRKGKSQQSFLRSEQFSMGGGRAREREEERERGR